MRRGGWLPLEQLTPYVLDVPAGKGRPPVDVRPAPLDWPAVFGNDNPVEIEVGFGKGLFLLNAGQAKPHINYLGIEIERKYQLYTATRIAKRRLPNLRVACADARVLLRDQVRDESVQAIHVYFPDPWWKQRHRKRRVLTEEFIGQCVRVLRRGGRLHLATDVEEYSAETQALLARQAALAMLPPPATHEPAHDFDYLTNFERKYRKEAKRIFRADYEKK